MKILGIKESSLIEWPSHLSFVIFIAGCNFRCSFCYVSHIVLPERYEKAKEIKQEKILQDIKERASKNFIDAVCITGGEPTIHSELFNFLEKIKEQNREIKIRLETNGSNPKLIEKLIKNKLIDSVAMDIKNTKEKYKETINSEINLEDIEKTIKLIKDSAINSNLDYEFRTTLVPGLHEQEDIKKIAKWLNNIEDKNKKIKLYVLQQFRTDLPQEQTLNPKFMKKGNYPFEKIKEIKEELEKLGWFERVEVRGEEG